MFVARFSLWSEHSGLKGEIPEKKSPKISQWIPSPKIYFDIFLHFETELLDYKCSRKETKPNFGFGITFIQWHFSKYAIKRKFKFWALRGNFRKSCRLFDFMGGGLFSATFSEIPTKRLKIEIFTFYGSFLGILRAYFEICHKIKVVPNPKLGLVTYLLTL